MDNFIWWIGVVHLGAYALAAFAFASALFVEWALKKLSLHQKVVVALWFYYKDRARVNDELERQKARKAARKAGEK